jgi:hypothetical protein
VSEPLPSEPRPTAPISMGGSHRQADPSELEHDRLRWRLSLSALLALVGGCAMNGAGVAQLLGLVVGIPLGAIIQIGEIRFRVAPQEFRLFVAELPSFHIGEFVIWLGLTGAAIFKEPRTFAWLLAGAWLYDFLTYYRRRPEMLRHLYAVATAIDRFRRFRLPWLYPLPLLVWAIWRS